MFMATVEERENVRDRQIVERGGNNDGVIELMDLLHEMIQCIHMHDIVCHGANIGQIVDIGHNGIDHHTLPQLAEIIADS